MTLRTAVTFFAVSLLGLTAACNSASRAVRATGGDPAKGHDVLAHYGCTACHSIPGLSQTGDVTGPSLAHVGSAATLADGQVQNTPENLVLWIQAPARMKPSTSMPSMNVNEKDARDIAAFLCTLR
ncbi:MAG TPA: cytochrome c [Candidatus Acidoferrales bacterium]|nr:cytochrome c [Candidatus Acidoferrales bacterium]